MVESVSDFRAKFRGKYKPPVEERYTKQGVQIRCEEAVDCTYNSEGFCTNKNALIDDFCPEDSVCFTYTPRLSDTQVQAEG